MFALAFLLALVSVAFGRHHLTHEFRHTIERDGVSKTVTVHANEPKGICDTVTQYSGYFSAGGSKEYFYWFFESRNNPSTDPLIMWLTGGPGCSSVLALLVENGPCHVNTWASDTYINNASWNIAANLLYVDQPPGTGFSNGPDDTTEDEIADDMYNFLQAFAAQFPTYFQHKFYIFGESYGGHYVPNIAYRVFEGNNAIKNGATSNDATIPLAGFAIGNGLTDPYIQFEYYAKMAYDSGTAPSVISEGVYETMTKLIPQCQEKIMKCNEDPENNPCDQAYNACMESQVEPVTATGVNPYDLRVPCGDEQLCYNFTMVDIWLNNATVQKEIGVDKKWESCNTMVNERLEQDWMRDYQNKVPPMLAGNVKGMIYAGDQDFICNWLGNQAWSLALNWTYATQFNAQTPQPWSPDGTERGMIRTYKNFTFLQVYKAGHMVPLNQPTSALEMVKQYLADYF